MLSNALEWKRFKFVVGVVLSYVAWGRRKMLTLREPLRPVLLKACRFVQRAEVNNTLVYFGLLDEADVAGLSVEGGQEGGGAAAEAPFSLPTVVSRASPAQCRPQAPPPAPPTAVQC